MSKPRRVLIAVRVTDTEKKLIEKRAQQLGLTVSEYMRSLALKVA
jgi:uncharacterized protein (DUF1778 family)